LTMQPLLANPDPTTLPRPAVKWAFEPPRAQDVPAALARAFRYATLPPAGPVFVSLPMDDFEQPAEAGTTELLAARRLTGRSVPAPVELNALAKLRGDIACCPNVTVPTDDIDDLWAEIGPPPPNWRVIVHMNT
jgi:thiamine pyrophosphate-dependent acetolactate synthase large subunit-like protein